MPPDEPSKPSILTRSESATANGPANPGDKDCREGLRSTIFAARRGTGAALQYATRSALLGLLECRRRFCRWRLDRQRLFLGERMYSRGLGDAEILGRLQELGEVTGNGNTGKTSAGGSTQSRRELLSQLADSVEAPPDPTITTFVCDLQSLQYELARLEQTRTRHRVALSRLQFKPREQQIFRASEATANAGAGRHLRAELQAIGVATYRQTVRLIQQMAAARRLHLLKRSHRQAGLVLGERVYEAGVGDPTLRKQIGDHDEKIREAKAAGRSPRKLLSLRNVLLSQLADAQVQQTAPRTELPEYATFIAAGEAVESHRTFMKANRAVLPPTSPGELRRVGIGYAALSCLLLAAFVLAEAIVTGKSLTPGLLGRNAAAPAETAEKTIRKTDRDRVLLTLDKAANAAKAAKHRRAELYCDLATAYTSIGEPRLGHARCESPPAPAMRLEIAGKEG